MNVPILSLTALFVTALFESVDLGSPHPQFLVETVIYSPILAIPNKMPILYAFLHTMSMNSHMQTYKNILSICKRHSFHFGLMQTH